MSRKKTAEPEWIDPEIVFRVHERQIREHGGRAGIRDRGLIESALHRPRSLAHYEAPDVARLAASYVYGIAKNHGFVDGNKRTAWITACLFLDLKGWNLDVDAEDAVQLMNDVASSQVNEEAVAAWFRERISKRDEE